MTNDKERREITSGIRQFLSMPYDERPWEHDGLQTVGRLVGAYVGESILARLADLIDRPTCSIKRESRNGYPTTWGVCSRCGAIVNAERAVSNAIEYLPTRYCPNCGAEVVNDA